MTNSFKLFFFCSVFSTVASIDAHALTGEAAKCFAGKLPVFQIIAHNARNLPDATRQLDTTCDELDRDSYMTPATLKEKAIATIGYVDVGLFFGGALAAFDRLKGSEAQRNYMSQLVRIKKIQDPIERIRQTYELAAGISGAYDYDTMGQRTDRRGYYVGAYRPSNLIDSATASGSIGICREYAHLLVWSLLQVSRAEGSTTPQLGPNDFSANLKLGFLDMGHAWVRAHLPHYVTGQLVGFVDFDLDTNAYSKFQPLFIRKSNETMKIRAEAKRECSEISRCL